jgi:hypothetical protein
MEDGRPIANARRWTLLLVVLLTPGAHGCDKERALCGTDEYRDYEANSCGDKEDDGGACVARPEACADVGDPVCACDGKTYGNACEAQRAGQDESIRMDCPAMDEGAVPCGSHFCYAEEHQGKSLYYCEVVAGDRPQDPATFFCRDLPQSCVDLGEAATCDCFPDSECECEQPEAGQFRLTCPGA